MVFILKALAGTLAFGGIATPIALSQFEDPLLEYIEEITPENKNLKVRKVLQWLKEKDCQLIQNPENGNNWSNAIYACEKQENGRASFYYVGPENSFITEIESNLIRKISSVNYLANKEKETAMLFLGLEDGESINWAVAFESGWRYFKNVSLSEQCSVRAKALGGDDLLCKLEDTNSAFYYSFSVF